MSGSELRIRWMDGTKDYTGVMIEARGTMVEAIEDNTGVKWLLWVGWVVEWYDNKVWGGWVRVDG